MTENLKQPVSGADRGDAVAQKQLMEMAQDVEMFAPGGTMSRHFIHMLKGRNCDNGFYEAFTNEVDIRVALDPIVDDVLKRYRMIE